MDTYINRILNIKNSNCDEKPLKMIFFRFDI